MSALNSAVSLTGEWEGPLQGQPWGSCGGLPHCQGPHRGAGPPAEPRGSGPRVRSGGPAGGRVHTDGDHVRAHHGSGQASPVNTTRAWYLPLPALRQVQYSELSPSLCGVRYEHYFKWQSSNIHWERMEHSEPALKCNTKQRNVTSEGRIECVSKSPVLKWILYAIPQSLKSCTKSETLEIGTHNLKKASSTILGILGKQQRKLKPFLCFSPPLLAFSSSLLFLFFQATLVHVLQSISKERQTVNKIKFSMRNNWVSAQGMSARRH